MSTPQLLSDRYELDDTIGYGGMSEVHKGRDIRLSRDVAVKVLRADLARESTFQERFRREAQNAAALNHPAIVAVYDTGETKTENGPLPYIVMEYVDGKTLRDIVKTEGPLSGKRAMEVMADVCAALDFSHRNGIVHRDVKPANVMITKTGAVKVMDFGIARALADGQAAVTQTAAVIGTAQYLSPEQARGESVDARSDVYSAGCVLFELLTGEPPFTGDSPVAVAYQHVREDPKPPSSVNPQVTPALDAIVLKALAKNPANRYQTAAEMRGDLVRVLSGQRPSAPVVMTDEDRTTILTGRGAPATTPSRQEPDDYDYDPDVEEERKRRRRKAWITAGVVALCVAVLAIAAWITTSLLGNKNDNQVAVPNGLVGATQQSAINSLQSAGLHPNVQNVPCQPDPNNGGQMACTTDQINKVLNTDPKEGTKVDPGSSVTLRVGANPKQVQIPDVSGKSPQDATNALKTPAVNLSVSPDNETQEVDDSMVGKVIGTDPKAGTTVTMGSTVKLIVGKKRNLVTVPDVTNQNQSQAQTNLTNIGLQVNVQQVDGVQPAGTVIAQDPPGGSKQPPGTTITISVSQGNQFALPNITNMTPQQAQATLAKSGWTGTFQQTGTQNTNDITKNGQIASSNPAGGQPVRRDQTIQITTYKFGPPTPSSSSSPPPSHGGGGHGG
ncbi:MAG: Stk1 family PASTA domain-containing Ser/Thr kinase [Sciscionella sp.]|nr:Stk1 family PASTA domain-containing Ser/Thr kinase [Sciscionella sp.]